MIKTIAKLKAPWFGGKATVQFVKNFHRMKPAHRVSLLDQIAKQIRDERDLAARHLAIEIRDDDIRNAEAATLRGEPETATS
jgi:ubiquinone biosynthesis protein UbiJ